MEMGVRFEPTDQLEKKTDLYFRSPPLFSKIFLHKLIRNNHVTVGNTRNKSINKHGVIIERSDGKKFFINITHLTEECRGCLGRFFSEFKFSADSFPPLILGRPTLVIVGVTAAEGGNINSPHPRERRVNTTDDQHDCSSLGEEGSCRKGVDKRPHA